MSIETPASYPLLFKNGTRFHIAPEANVDQLLTDAHCLLDMAGDQLQTMIGACTGDESTPLLGIRFMLDTGLALLSELEGRLLVQGGGE